MDNYHNEPPLLGNRYKLLEIIGTGGMSVVYRAFDTMLERYVAAKILRSDYSEVLDFLDRFKSEAKAAANLSHPNIVTIYDFGVDHNRYFIVMEYVPGTDLKTILNKNKNLSMQVALHYAIQACAGIGYAHRAGLVHCDIKPHNLLVTPDGRIKVGDFGIARALSSIKPDEHVDIVWGSPFYFSPEQASGLAPSPASDVYSLGIVIYEMLTGVLPFTGNTPEELAYLHRERTPRPMKEIISSMHPTLDQIVLKVLSKEPANRYRTADQLGRVLLTFLQTTQLTFATKKHHSTSPPLKQWLTTKINNITAKSKTPRRPIYEGSRDSTSHLDWGTITLSLVALIMAGGLIPFWLFVYFTLYPPG